MKSSEPSAFEFFQFKKIFGIGQGIQIIAIACLFLLMTFGYYFSVQATGKMDGYSPGVSLLFVPIYEELIFRGLLLRFFEKHYGIICAIVFASVLFGLWHVKNIFWLQPDALTQQVLYTALFFSPITCWITYKTRSVWPAVMIHYLNNFPLDAWLNHFK
jgi:membrane protease YdiL (CAAX protease family)